MKRCHCGAPARMTTNQPRDTFVPDAPNLKFSVTCDAGCGAKTSYYDMQRQAMEAWDAKGWLNRRNPHR